MGERIAGAVESVGAFVQHTGYGPHEKPVVAIADLLLTEGGLTGLKKGHVIGF